MLIIFSETPGVGLAIDDLITEAPPPPAPALGSWGALALGAGLAGIAAARLRS